MSRRVYLDRRREILHVFAFVLWIFSLAVRALCLLFFIFGQFFHIFHEGFEITLRAKVRAEVVFGSGRGG